MIVHGGISQPDGENMPANPRGPQYKNRLSKAGLIFDAFQACGDELTSGDIAKFHDMDRNLFRRVLDKLTAMGCVDSGGPDTIRRYSIIPGKTKQDFLNAMKGSNGNTLWQELPSMPDKEFEALVWSWADERLDRLQNGRNGTGIPDDPAVSDYWLGVGGG